MRRAGTVPLHLDVETEVPIPPTLVDELFTLGKNWAEAHAAEFERMAVDDFDDLIQAIVYDEFDQVRTTLKRAERSVTRILQGDDYCNGMLPSHAPAQLLELIGNSVKMLRCWGMQAEATAEAIREAAAAHTGRDVTAPGMGAGHFFTSRTIEPEFSVPLSLAAAYNFEHLGTQGRVSLLHRRASGAERRDTRGSVRAGEFDEVSAGCSVSADGHGCNCCTGCHRRIFFHDFFHVPFVRPNARYRENVRVNSIRAAPHI